MQYKTKHKQNIEKIKNNTSFWCLYYFFILFFEALNKNVIINTDWWVAGAHKNLLAFKTCNKN
ncbi:MAG: hypothetical protein J5779_00400 [Clostridia bacterium]|nr:hypothetical protein [Clostridia bacterium]